MNTFDLHAHRYELPLDLSSYGFINKKTESPVNTSNLSEVREFIAVYFNKCQSINPNRSSYNLKHIVEKMIGRYVSNGELIAAMILEGYKWRRIEGTANCFFNLAERGMSYLWEVSVKKANADMKNTNLGTTVEAS